MMKKLFRKEKGFTLIELIIVVAIIGIIAGIAIPRFLGVRTKAKVTRAFADMASIGTALEMYYTEEDEYPQTLGDVKLKEYISSIPDEPFGTEDALEYRYYVNDATSATLWLLVSNGPDGTANETAPDLTGTLVAGQLGGPDGVLSGYGFIYTDDQTEGWSIAGDSRDLGDIGRAGP